MAHITPGMRSNCVPFFLLVLVGVTSFFPHEVSVSSDPIAIMHLLRGLALSLLAGTSLAVPGHNVRRSADKPAKYTLKQPPLTTPWTDDVGTNPWPEYPRPQMQRSQWHNLNGIWQYENASSLSAVEKPPFGQSLAQEVLVPFCLESGLSGW